MKAIVQERFGPPESLELVDAEVPDIGDGEILVQVHAAALNPYDWHMLRGDPLIARLGTAVGRTRPASRVAGLDGAGLVAAVGAGVPDLKPGDPVYGFFKGSLAEFARAEAGKIAPKPASLTFEEAASLPLAGVTALQCLRDGAKLRAGQRIAIVGASGGIGTLAVQLAKATGAEVTGVCSTRNLDLVRSLGATHVVDYTQEDFTATGELYDVIFENAGGCPLRSIRRALAPTGVYIANNGGPAGRHVFGPIGPMLRAVVVNPFVKQRLGPFMAREQRADLLELTRLVEEGSLRPVLDRTYPLVDSAEALRQVEAGHVRGKVTVTVVD